MGRAPCCDKSKVKKGPWSQEEDVKLKEYIDKNGTGGNWIALPQKAGLKRCGKSCRLRWLNYLRPNIRHGAFSNDEDRIICTLFATIGSRWSVIAAQLPGRTDNDIKNYWNTKLKKKLLGIPPSRRKPNVQQQEQQQQQQQQLFSASDLESMPISSSLLQLEAIQLPPVHVHDDVSHQYQSSSYKLLMFGGPPEQISCSSSDQLEFGRVEGVGFDNYLYGESMDNHILQKPFLGGGGGGGAGELTQDLQYGSYEDIKNLLGWHQQSMH